MGGHLTGKWGDEIRETKEAVRGEGEREGKRGCTYAPKLIAHPECSSEMWTPLVLTQLDSLPLLFPLSLSLSLSLSPPLSLSYFPPGGDIVSSEYCITAARLWQVSYGGSDDW